MMHIDNNKRLFLDMQEHPENYSDEQLEVMMNDIDRDPDTDAVWNQFVQKGSGNVSAARKWLKIAAMFICILLMTGIALAAYKTIVDQPLTRSHQMYDLTTYSSIVFFT